MSTPNSSSLSQGILDAKGASSQNFDAIRINYKDRDLELASARRAGGAGVACRDGDLAPDSCHASRSS
eukprot:974966-Pleurochrysis_carterae.AAC.1